MVGWDLRLGTDSMCMTQRISAVSCCQATVVNKCMTTSKRQNQRKSPLYQGLTRFRSANFSLVPQSSGGCMALLPCRDATSERLVRRGICSFSEHARTHHVLPDPIA